MFEVKATFWRLIGSGVLAMIPGTAANLYPQPFSLRFPDVNPRDVGQMVLADSQGNVFVVALAQRAFVYGPPPASTLVVANVHVTKTDGSGNVLASFEFGGSGIDTPKGAAVDGAGNLVIVGTTTSADFPLVSPLQSAGSTFITKIDSQLQTILFSTLWGGAGATGVAVDSSGNIYVTGTTGYSTMASFPTTPGVLQPSAPAPPVDGIVSSGFVSEISTAGDRVIFSTYFGASGFTCYSSGNPCISFPGLTGPEIFTTPQAIALDSSGNVIIVGSTNANNLPVSTGAYAPWCGCTNMFPAGFVAKVAAGGIQLVWGTYIPLETFPGVPGDITSPTISGMALDAAANIVLVGNSQAGFPVTQGAEQTAYPVPAGVESFYSHGEFVAKLSASGSQLLFGTYFGEDLPSAPNSPGGVAIDATGTIWLTGSSPVSQLPGVGTTALGTDYIAGLSSDGSSVVSMLTAPNGAAGAGVAVTAQGTLAALGPSGALLISSLAAGTPSTAPSLMGVVGSAATSVSPSVCGRELISFYGLGIGPATPMSAQVTNSAISNSLGGVQVLFDGVPAALLYAGPTQINAIVPSGVAGQSRTKVQIVTPTGTIDAPMLGVQATMPQVFTNSTGAAAAMNQDGSVNTSANPAQPGSIVTIWMTGGGAAPASSDNTINSELDSNPFPVSVLAANAYQGTSSLDVSYSGDAPGMASGVIQVNFQLPEGPLGFYYDVQVGAAIAVFVINVAD
jgi:uncharacterized protein (TIGR03437 family)